MDSIFHRRSIRRFTDQPVSEEQIMQIIKAGMAAPTACNDKQWVFYAITNPDMKELISESSKYAGCARLAPVDLVLCYQKETGFAPEYTDINMAIVAENMLLEADQMELGGVFLGVAPEKDRMAALHKILDLPENEEAFCIMPIGYPAEPRPKDVDKTDTSRVHFIK